MNRDKVRRQVSHGGVLAAWPEGGVYKSETVLDGVRHVILTDGRIVRGAPVATPALVPLSASEPVWRLWLWAPLRLDGPRNRPAAPPSKPFRYPLLSTVPVTSLWLWERALTPDFTAPVAWNPPHSCLGCGAIVCEHPDEGLEDCPEQLVGSCAHWCGRCEWWDAPHGALLPGAESEREADERAYDLAVNASIDEARESGRRPRPVTRRRSCGGWR